MPNLHNVRVRAVQKAAAAATPPPRAAEGGREGGAARYRSTGVQRQQRWQGEGVRSFLHQSCYFLDDLSMCNRLILESESRPK
jgi:hypothetical protein